LDKLLEGLDKLTETLPDLKDVRSFTNSQSKLSETLKNGSSFLSPSSETPEVFRLTSSTGLDSQNSLIRPSIVAKHSLGGNEVFNSSSSTCYECCAAIE